MPILVIATVVGLVLAGFNNCSDVAFKVSEKWEQELRNALSSSSAIIIENGAEFTRNSPVQVKLTSPRAVEMKISNSDTCADGNWEPFSSSKSWPVQNKNKEVKIFVEFKDVVGNISPCTSDEIIHDDIPPQASFSSPGGVITNDPALVVHFTSSDNLSGVDSIICRHDTNAPVACTAMMAVNASTDGNNRIGVKVSDKAGNESAEFVYSWLLDRAPPVVSINTKPAAITGSANAILGFSATDALSGIDRYLCKIDGGAEAACASPMNYAGLAEGAHKFDVRAVDRAGNISAPVSANWSIDMSAPVLMFTQTPPPLTNSTNATFAFTGSDNGQPVTQFECKLDSGAFASCSSPRNLSGLSQGSHAFEVRGYDSAGNVSEPIRYSWRVDTAGPQINITLFPPPFSNLTSAVFQWTVTDNDSGVKMVECSLDSGAYAACAMSGQTFNNIAAGSHSLTVRATDNAGNQSTAAKSWTVDLVPPTVQITSGPAPYIKALTAPLAFVGTDANGIQGYECRIDAGNFAACSSIFTTPPLMEGGHVFSVRAIDNAGNVSAPAQHSWAIDLSPPIIRVVSAPTIIKQGDPAIIKYETVDLASGVDNVQCGLASPQVNMAACPAMHQVNLGAALAMGSYIFEIKSTDKVGNAMTERVSFQVTARPVICDPFVAGGEEACDGGMIGDIYYLDANARQQFVGMANKTVDFFYSNGTLVNALINLKQLFVSTRSFTAGFPTSMGGLILDNAGNTLHEYFAFRMETVLKLDVAADLPGFYQFAVLSDDGSMLLTKASGSNMYNQAIVSNDGDHSTRMGCSASATYLDDTSRIPLQVKYYQGPATEIALTVMWRRVEASNSPLHRHCGVAGNDAFFGPSPYGNFTTSRYAELLADGWKVIAPKNFIAPPRP
jgi:hypothetical protein